VESDLGDLSGEKSERVYLLVSIEKYVTDCPFIQFANALKAIKEAL